MNILLAWIYLNCAAACGASFWHHTDSRVSIKACGAVVVGIIGPIIFPWFIFVYALEAMGKWKPTSTVCPPTERT